METLKISLGELIAGIPVLLEHDPKETVVALSVNEHGMPTCAFSVARKRLLDPVFASVTAAAIAEELAAEPCQFAVLVSYTDDDIRAGCRALDALRLEVEFAVPRVEALGVRGGEWFRPGCFDDDCCPRRVPAVPGSFPAVIAAARRRAEAVAEVSERAMTRAGRRIEARFDAASAWEDALEAGAVADAAAARRLAASLDDLCVRDWLVLTVLGAEPEAALCALAGMETGAVSLALEGALRGPASPDPRETDRARAVVERVARAARGRRRKAATHTLVAVLDWWEGNLNAARERCESALHSDAQYRLAELVWVAAERGIGPGWLAQSGQTAQ